MGVSINLGESFYLAGQPSWAKKKGYQIRRRPRQSSPFLKAQQDKLAAAAASAYGTPGILGVASKVAAQLGRTAQMQTQVGIAGKRLTGEAASRALARRENKHRITQARLSGRSVIQPLSI